MYIHLIHSGFQQDRVMSSRIRTIGSGLSVLAICLAMASLQGMQALTLLVAGSTLASLWFWLADLERRRKKERWLKRMLRDEAAGKKRAGNLPAGGRKSQVVREGNVYHLPAFGQSLGFGSGDFHEAGN